MVLQLLIAGIALGCISFSEMAYQRLRDDILRQCLKPGAVVSTAQLAQSMGVSPMPVRAAITRLETEGLVSVLPQRGGDHLKDLNQGISRTLQHPEPCRGACRLPGVHEHV